MWHVVFKEVFRLCWRTRFVVVFVFFSILIHCFGLLLPKQAVLSFQGIVTEVGSRQALFISLYLSFFVVFFLSVVFALWLVPYFHQGERTLLIFVWPVSKWTFPLAYSLQLLSLILVEWAVLLTSFGVFYGSGALFQPRFSWLALFQCFFLQVISSQAILFLLSSFSLWWGPVTTLFASAASFISLQVLATLERMGFFAARSPESSLFSIFLHFLPQIIPPLGDLVFDLKDTFSKGSLPSGNVALWFAWGLVGSALFRWTLSRPRQNFISQG